MIITVTLNPAMDKVLILDDFRLNVTNRIKEQFSCVGGKGTHISINLSLLGIRSKAVGAVMGPVGDEILKALQSMDIDVQFIKLEEGNSRINYVLVDNSDNCTLIAEKGRMMDDAAVEKLVERYSSVVNEGDIVVISGDASNQKGTELQDRLIDIAAAKKARFCLDASGTHLASGVRRGPFMIKPNLDELSSLYGRNLQYIDEIVGAIEQIADYGIENIIVSLGGEGSIARLNGRFYRAKAPQVKVRNTVGCGDALVSGMLAGFEKGLDIEDNLRQASAVAAATAMNRSTVGFDTGLVEELARKVVVEKIKGIV